MIRTKNAGVQKAKCMIQEMSLTETMREAWEQYRKKRMDRKSEDAYVYDQGKEAGEQIGIEMGRQEILFELVLNGKLDIDTAAESCGMTSKEFEQRLGETRKHG